LGVAGEEGE
ncbi:hypothetical protein MKD33_14600, partial [Chromobacterium piscinae]